MYVDKPLYHWVNNGNDSLSRAELLVQDNFYFVCGQECDTEFLEEFYSGQGMIVSLVKVDTISEGEDLLTVYAVEITGNKTE